MFESEDAVAFYAADIGQTRLLALTTASAQTPDDAGPLTPGRWLFQLLDPTGRAWVCFGPYERGVVVDATAAPGRQRIVCDADGVVQFEVNIRPGYNDRVAGIMVSGTANLYMTKISRGAAKRR